ncbi:MAG TPA: FixH family protein [Deltaproteobacteria bacterium]|nr:FixH family protein [Deltaproteobacteria bacterium]
MKRLTIVLLALLVMTTQAYAKGYEVNKQAGPYSVKVMLDKNPPVVGDNTVTVAIKDAAGKAVTNVKVSLNYEMPAMPGMPAMRYTAPATLRAQVYSGKMNFSMPGAWNVKVNIMGGGGTYSIKFNTDVQ